MATARRFEDESSPAIHEQLARLVFAESQVQIKDRRILDYGCGTGYNAFYLSERQDPQSVVGIDILERCIAYCREHYDTDRTSFHVQDCQVHNPDLGQFDVVISCEVLEHVLDQEAFLDAAARYLAPGGEAFISTPNRAVFSLGKSRSFNNKTHLRELFYGEFVELMEARFGNVRMYSQVHTGPWHDAYVNQLSLSNLLHALRYEYFGESLRGKVARRLVKRLLAKPLARFADRSYPDVRKRRFTDFDFVENFDDRAAWFVAIASDPV